MPRRKIIANIAGLAAVIAATWGFHGLMLTGSCGGAGRPPCPPEATPYFIAVTVGVVTVIGSSFAGGRFGVIGIFPAVGAGAIWAALESPPDERTGLFVMGGIFVAITLVPLVLIPIGAAKKRRAMRLVAEGGAGIGSVIEVSDTGVTVNKNPRVKLKLRIEPQDGSAAFDGEKSMTASRVALPYVGQRYPVWYDKADPTNFILGTKVDKNAPQEVQRLFALAQAADPGRGTTGAGAKGATDPLDRLAKLNELRQSGALSEPEFEEAKQKILEASELT